MFRRYAVRVRRSIACLAFCLPLAWAGNTSDDRPLCRKAFLEIVSPNRDQITSEQCKEVAKQVMAAWQFDVEQMQWSEKFDDHPLKVRLLTPERMKQEKGTDGVYGQALGRNTFLVTLRVLDNPATQGTLAHEIGHTQSFRAMTENQDNRPPRYFFEGQANLLGRRYRDQLQIANHGYDAGRAKQMAHMTPALAKTIFTDDSFGSLAHKDMKETSTMESMGVFFMEYLRVHFRGGVPDVLPRAGRVFEEIGRGHSFEKAFHHEFGAPIGKVISEILDFIARTEGNPDERLRGTIYAEFLKN